MKVICNNYNICRDRKECYHSKQHEIDGSCTLGSLINDNYYTEYGCTCCSITKKRKEKIQKLNETR